MSESSIKINSPGRVNLIGEHIDYNGGSVLPAAIKQHISIVMKKKEGPICHIKSEDLNSGFSVDLQNLQKSTFQWHNYILGVLKEMQLLSNGAIEGFKCTIKSNLPIGSGVSSSAALECGIAKGLNELFELGLSNEQIINLSRDAEHNFVGTHCGIMDQFAVVMGKKNTLINLNCKTLHYKYVNADFGPYQIVLFNTNISHNLASGEYNSIRKECELALELINENGKVTYDFLCDVPLEKIKNMKGNLPKTTYNRALFAVQENKRVFEATNALNDANLNLFGELLYQSHQGLRDLYQVSCDELDFLVDFSKQHPNVIGSRMMGGGFGGCTINLVHKDFLKIYSKKISMAYYKAFNLELSTILVNPGDGIRIHGYET